MPSLKKMLQSYDHDLIERIGSFWGLNVSDIDTPSANKALFEVMKNESLAAEILESLPQPARKAWDDLIAHPKKITWSQFIRKYGEVREIGPARREREDPEQHPVSAGEMLWYRGLIGRGFLNLPPEPREFVFIPDELLKMLAPASSATEKIKIDKIEPASLANLYPADGRIIDHMTDWLGAKRMEHPLPTEAWQEWHVNEPFFKSLAQGSYLMDDQESLLPEALADFFQKERSEILREWLRIWLESTKINELKSLPGLTFDGTWQNDPVKARHAILDILCRLETAIWYSLPSLVDTIKTSLPDFQRPSGDYDSWYIRKAENQEYLRGFEHWDEVDGMLIRYLISLLHRLGAVDMGREAEKERRVAFRLTGLFRETFQEGPANLVKVPEKKLKISPELVFTIPNFASRTLRYQIARFCEIRSISDLETCYEITANSLNSAQTLGLKPAQLLQLLEKKTQSPLPKALELVVKNRENNEPSVKIGRAVLLRTASTEPMVFLQQKPQTARLILELLTPTTALINPAGIKIIKQALLEGGWLSEIDPEL